jgi:hypothetical protein
MKEISKNLICIAIRGDIEMWFEKEKLPALELEIQSKGGFIRLGGNLVKTSEITGIFTAEVMAERTHRKNGDWQCIYGNWHERFKKCECRVNKMSGEDLAKFSRGF